MGYTHYPQQLRDLTDDEWETVSADIQTICNYVENVQGIPLRGWDSDVVARPEFNSYRISFNGAGDDGHETFAINRRIGEWECCKTARKPYDVAATAILCYLASVAETHNATSDGSGRDWLAGLELARQALPRYGNQLDIPMGVMERDRWVGPWFGMRTETYDVNLCVDGYAYITGPRGRSYRFYSHLEAAQWAASHIEKPITVYSSWGSGVSPEGGKSIFNAYGTFDEKRTAALKRAQDRVCKAMLDMAEGDRLIPPPKFMRPGEMPAIDESPRCYSFDDLLKLAA